MDEIRLATTWSQALFTPFLGDFNGDGNVTTADFDIMKANWLTTGNSLNVNGELTGPGGIPDGVVDLLDFIEFKELYPGGGSALAAALASAVPEPSGVMLLLAAAPACLLRRSRSGKDAA